MRTDSLLTQTIANPISGLLQPAVVQPKAALMHLPLTSLAGTYFRSKIISAGIGINPLLTAAAALLTLIAKLQNLSSQNDAYEIYSVLLHEIKAFEIGAQKQAYRSEYILAVRYLLCATLDEILLVAPCCGTEWHKYQLLQYFHGEESGGERFFLILNRLSANPKLHIDVLELIYLCLALGFNGQYQQQENGRVELDALMERLYDTIRQQRGDIKKALTIQERTIESPVPVAVQPLPMGLLLSFTLLLLLTVYFGFNFMLESSVTPLYQELNTIVQDYAADD